MYMEKTYEKLLLLFSTFSIKAIIDDLRLIRKLTNDLESKEWALQFEEILFEVKQSPKIGLVFYSEEPAFVISAVPIINFIDTKEDFFKNILKIEDCLIQSLESGNVENFKKCMLLLGTLKKIFKD